MRATGRYELDFVDGCRVGVCADCLFDGWIKSYPQLLDGCVRICQVDRDGLPLDERPRDEADSTALLARKILQLEAALPELLRRRF